MRILLTNDDGIDAPGIAAMLEALEDAHDVVVVAPSKERSGASHALTMLEPIRLVQKGERRWAVGGTPVDCVYLGLHRVFSEPPEVVISGINKGANLGDDVFYSGTVGAAREAALNQIPAIAVSLDTQNWSSSTSLHFESAANIALKVLDSIKAKPLSPGAFVNLNVPNRPLSEIPTVEVCRLGRRHYEPVVEERIDPRAHAYYWIGGEPLSERMGEQTDGWWLHKGHAAITPLGLNNTSENHLSQLKHWNITNSSGRGNERT
mgnify:CR=1 FL=1